MHSSCPLLKPKLRIRTKTDSGVTGPHVTTVKKSFSAFQHCLSPVLDRWPCLAGRNCQKPGFDSRNSGVLDWLCETINVFSSCCCVLETVWPPATHKTVSGCIHSWWLILHFLLRLKNLVRTSSYVKGIFPCWSSEAQTMDLSPTWTFGDLSVDILPSPKRTFKINGAFENEKYKELIYSKSN